MARYSLFVLKVPLNSNQPFRRVLCCRFSSRAIWSVLVYPCCIFSVRQAAVVVVDDVCDIGISFAETRLLGQTNVSQASSDT